MTTAAEIIRMLDPRIDAAFHADLRETMTAHAARLEAQAAVLDLRDPQATSLKAQAELVRGAISKLDQVQS